MDRVDGDDDDDRSLWSFMDRWEAQQHQAENELMDIDHANDPMDMVEQQEGGAFPQYEPLPPLFDFDMESLIHRRSVRL